jgi:hypothetical protein
MHGGSRRSRGGRHFGTQKRTRVELF